MTLLEYALRKYIGPPPSTRTWRCPIHDDSTPSFVMFAPHPDYRDRAKCFGCGWRGDVYDLLRVFHPLESFPELGLRVRDLERQLVQSGGHVTSSSLRGKDRHRQIEIRYAAGSIWADYVTKHGLPLSNPQLQRRCSAEGITLHDLVNYDVEFHATDLEMLERHAAECDDPFCGEECRTARGLPTLTPVEFEQHRREREQEKKEKEQAIIEQQKRIAKAMRNVRSR